MRTVPYIIPIERKKPSFRHVASNVTGEFVIARQQE
jgi:hypothetical protein